MIQKLTAHLRENAAVYASIGVITTIVFIVVGSLIAMNTRLANERREAAELRLEQAEVQLGASQEALVSAQEQLRDALSSIGSLEARLAASDARIETLEERGQALLSQVEQARMELQELRARNSELSRSYNERGSDLWRLERRNEDLTAEVGRLEAQLVAYISALASQMSPYLFEDLPFLNSGLQNFELSSWPITIEGWQVDAAYIIRRKNHIGEEVSQFDLLGFEEYEYTLNSGFYCSAVPQLCSELCELMGEAASSLRMQQASEYEQVMLRIGTMEFGLEYEQSQLAELATIFRLFNSYSENTHLFLRGFADGQDRQWSRVLSDEFAPDRIQYLALDVDRCTGPFESCMRFDGSDFSDMQIGDTYSSIELPNLRASYVAENVRSVIESCADFRGQPEIFILEGVDDRRLSAGTGMSFRSVRGVIIIGQPIL